jgi:hypothetical protein
MNPGEVPCVFQIPLQYNDGTPVEPEKWLLFLDILNRQFEGYSPLGRIEGGCWHGQVESSERFEVWVTREQIPLLERVVRAIGKEMGQQEMFLIVPDATVRRFPITDATPGLFDFANGF